MLLMEWLKSPMFLLLFNFFCIRITKHTYYAVLEKCITTIEIVSQLSAGLVPQIMCFLVL